MRSKERAPGTKKQREFTQPDIDGVIVQLLRSKICRQRNSSANRANGLPESAERTDTQCRQDCPSTLRCIETMGTQTVKSNGKSGHFYLAQLRDLYLASTTGMFAGVAFFWRPSTLDQGPRSDSAQQNRPSSDATGALEFRR